MGLTLSLALIGCGGDDDAALEGTWATEGDASQNQPPRYLRFDDDGSWGGGDSPDGTGFDSGTYSVDGSTLTLNSDENSACGEVTATYEVSISDADVLTLSPVEDPCEPRSEEIQTLEYSPYTPDEE